MEALLTKQRCNYQRICAAFKIDSSPIKAYLFKATDLIDEPIGLDSFHQKNMVSANESFHHPKLGWDDVNNPIDLKVILVDGNHATMMRDPKNRYLLGRKITEVLQHEKH